MEDHPTLMEILEHVANAEDRRLDMALLSRGEYQALRAVIATVLSHEIQYSFAPSEGVIHIVKGRARELIDKAIAAVEEMIQIYHASQDLPIKVTTSSVLSVLMETPGVSIRMDTEAFSIKFRIPCADFWQWSGGVLDELQRTLEGLREVREKLEELYRELEKPAPEPLALVYARSIIEAIGR